MEIPKQFKKAISNYFYDKDIKLLKEEIIYDEEGGTSATIIETDSFKGNINYSISDEVQKEYGLSENISVLITTDKKIPDKSYIGYKDTYYKVIAIKERDSHYLIIGANYGD